MPGGVGQRLACQRDNIGRILACLGAGEVACCHVGEGFVLGCIAGAAPEEPDVAGEPDVVHFLAVALGGYGVAGAVAGAGQGCVSVGAMGYVSHGVGW